MDTWIALLQWPAMACSLLAGWLVASKERVRRTVGFWIFLGSNLLWVGWGWHDHAYALIALQIGLAITNVRGVVDNEFDSNE